MKVLSRLLSSSVAANALGFLSVNRYPAGHCASSLYIFCVPIFCHGISRSALVASALLFL